MALPALDGSQDNYLFVESGAASLGTFKQYVTSNSLFTLDYSDYLTTNETLTTVAYSVLPVTTPPPVVSSSTLVTINGVAKKGVSFLLGGGVEGTLYTVTITATTTLPQTKVDNLKLNVTPGSSAYCGGGYPIGCPSYPPGYPTVQTSRVPEGTLAFFSQRVGVSLNPMIVANQRSQRHAVTIGNVGVSYCELSHTSPFNLGDGIPLPPGAAVTLDTQAAVYGRSQTYIGNLSVMETY